MKTVRIGDVQITLHGLDTVEGLGVEILSHVGSLSLPLSRTNRLIHHLKHTNRGVVAVGVNSLRHPFKKLSGSLIVLGRVEFRVREGLQCVSTKAKIQDQNNSHDQ